MRYITYLLVLVTLAIYSCDPSFDCKEVDTLTNFDNLQNADSITYMSERIMANEKAFDTLYNEMVIFVNNDAEYDVIKQKAINNSCSECVFPSIDFSRRTLIGYYFEIGCVQAPRQRFVATSDSTYAFYSKFINDQKCAFFVCPNQTFNWLLVPKVDEKSDVEFYNGEFYYDCDC